MTVVPPAVYTDATYDLDGTILTPGQTTFTLTPTQNRTDIDFGYRGLSIDPTTRTGLGNLVFEDLNGNGLQDVGELGIDGVPVVLYDSTGTNILAITTTAGGGLYSFTGLIPGIYQIRLGDANSTTTYIRSAANQGADNTIDSDANTTTGFSWRSGSR
ncbi:MAG: hypothetical protein K8T89_09840 [Planctomycetes bacterium]|nr:hypothetical protein [Planctomycetota bacterium]